MHIDSNQSRNSLVEDWRSSLPSGPVHREDIGRRRIDLSGILTLSDFPEKVNASVG